MKKVLPFIMSGILALPTMAFGASSVRTLGGSGTYNGVTSVGTGTATRAGSIRSVPSIRTTNTTATTTNTGVKATTPTVTTTNTGSGTRMSIGKYLSGAGVVSSTVSSGGVSAADYQSLDDQVSALTERLDEFLDGADSFATKEDLLAYLALDNTDDYLEQSITGADGVLNEYYLTETEIRDIIDKLSYIDDDTLTAKLADYLTSDQADGSYAKKTDILSQQDIAGIIAGAVTDPTTGVLKDYAKTSDLNVFATTEAVNGGFNTVNGEIDTIKGTIQTLNSGVASVDMPTSCDGGECLYMLSDTTDAQGGSVKSWQKFTVADTFNPADID